MNWYLIGYLSSIMLMVEALSRAGRVLGTALGVWSGHLTLRGHLATLLIRDVLIGIALPLIFPLLIIYILITSSPDEFAAFGSGFLLVLAVALVATMVVAAVRETRAWIAWSSYYRGAALLHDKRYAEALALSERILKRHPKTIGAWTAKALALYEMGRGAEALAAIERALVLAPQQYEGWVWKARVLIALQRDAEALAALNHALALAPRVAAIWARQGYTLARLGQNAEALAACERALNQAVTPDSSPASQGLALATMATALNGLGRSAEALATAERAIPLNPYPIRSRLAQAIALERLGQPEEARNAAEQGLAVAERYLVDDPSMIAAAEIWSVKAALLRQIGRANEADAAEARSQELYAAIRGEAVPGQSIAG